MNSLLLALKEAGVKNPKMWFNMITFRGSVAQPILESPTATITGDNIENQTVSAYDVIAFPDVVVARCAMSIRKESKHKRNLPDWF